MTVNEYMVWIIGMAIAIITILVVGTLASADLLHRPGSGNRAEDARLRTPAHREDGVVEALAPVGSSLAAGSRLQALHRQRDHDSQSALPAA